MAVAALPVVAAHGVALGREPAQRGRAGEWLGWPPSRAAQRLGFAAQRQQAGDVRLSGRCRHCVQSSQVMSLSWQ